MPPLTISLGGSFSESKEITGPHLQRWAEALRARYGAELSNDELFAKWTQSVFKQPVGETLAYEQGKAGVAAEDAVTPIDLT